MANKVELPHDWVSETQLTNGCKLEHKTIGRLSGQFIVPDYQRGYRWEKEDVRRLLDDIWERQGQPYSLQPVVVKPYSREEHGNRDQWELIDGQQRLTTLYLVFRYIQQQGWKKNGAPFTLSYVTRQESQDYLQNLGADSARDAQLSTKNIDYFHLYQAYCEIAAWFADQGNQDHIQENAAGKLNSFLYDSVRIIWYEVPPTTNVTALFTRLNVGRIPLTDAELIKAALLSAVRAVSTDRSQEIAAQWDGIERDLHRKEIWAFVAGLSGESNDDRYPTRISLLLDTLADQHQAPPAGGRQRYYTFDILKQLVETNPTEFWKSVVALHAQILGWFEQPTTYNKIGFLVAVANDNAAELRKIIKESGGKKKSELDGYLISAIRDTICTTAEGIETLNYEDRKRGYGQLVQLLLLMNVETASKTGQRFPFSEHVGRQWSLEHIHAQNTDTLNKADQWKAWLCAHALALDAVQFPEGASTVAQIKQDVQVALTAIASSNPQAFSGLEFAALSHRILELLNRDDAVDHSICNIALLSREDNSHLNNAVFEVKRQKILERDRGGRYVPACTRNVFLKYYTNADAQQPHFWSEQDKTAYLLAIKALLKPYYLAPINEAQA